MGASRRQLAIFLDGMALGGNTLVIPMVVGVNLVFGGLRLVYWGKGGSEKRRAVSQKQE